MSTARILVAMSSTTRLETTGRATGTYLPEVAHAWAVWSQAGYAIDLMSVGGGRPPLEAVDEKDPRQRRFLEDPVMRAKLDATFQLHQVDPERYVAVYFAGGHGAVWDLASEGMCRIAEEVFANGGVLSAVCHGPAVLTESCVGGRPLVEGREVTAFTNAEERAIGMAGAMPYLLEDRLVERGATFCAAPPFTPNVVVDGRLVTGQNPPAATTLAEAVLEVLKG